MDYILKPICVFVRYILSAEPQNVSCCQKSHASRKNTYMNQPNILILHLDQLRQDCLGCYGNPDVHTPNIDALAQDSVTYQNHFITRYIRSARRPVIRFSAACTYISTAHGIITPHFLMVIQPFQNNCRKVVIIPQLSEKCI